MNPENKMNQNEETRNKVLTNLIWRFMERCGAQLVAFIVTIVIARILDQEAYGIVALISVFTTILWVFVDSGLANALIQKKDADDLDFSTVFFANIVFCAVLYGLLFAGAPLIAWFYHNSSLTPLIRVSGITLLLSGVKNVQQAYVAKKLIFKRFFFATLGGTLGAAVVGIVMALSGYGVWALVISNLFNTTVDTIILWITVKWRPIKKFSMERLKGLFAFGSKMLAANVLNVIYENLYQLIIGKGYSTEELAYFDKGKQIPSLVIDNIDSSINSVIFPVMSENHDNSEDVKSIMKRALKVNIYTMTPILAGIAAVADPLVRLLLTEKWMPAVPYIRIICFVQIFRPINSLNINAIKSKGRSDLILRLQIWKNCSSLVILLLTMRYGVLAIAWGMVVSGFVSQIINAWPNRNLLDYGYLSQLADIMPSLILAFIMGVLVYGIELIGLNDWFTLLIQITFGVTIYVGGSWLFKMESFVYEKELIKNWFIKKHKGDGK